MCIAIMKPAGLNITDEVLKTCFDNNNDGAGFAYINVDNEGKRKIKIKKTMDYSTFLRQYKRALRVAPESPFLIHFRIRTSGTTDTFNCHPFSIDQGHCFIHNGIINNVGTDARKNDTQLFNEQVLQQLPEGWMENEAIKSLVEDRIGYSKLAILNINGDVQLYNEHKGTWKDGVWYSNTSYQPRAVYSSGYSYNRSYSNSNTKTPNSKGTTSSATGKNSCYPCKTEWSHTLCTKCRCSKSIKNMAFIGESDTIKGYCLTCVATLLEQDKIKRSDYMHMKQYLDWYNEGSGVGDDIGLHYLPITAEIEWWGSEIDNPYLDSNEDYMQSLEDEEYEKAYGYGGQ